MTPNPLTVFPPSSLLFLPHLTPRVSSSSATRSVPSKGRWVSIDDTECHFEPEMIDYFGWPTYDKDVLGVSKVSSARRCRPACGFFFRGCPGGGLMCDDAGTQRRHTIRCISVTGCLNGCVLALFWYSSSTLLAMGKCC